VKFALFPRWRWSISPPKHCLISDVCPMTYRDVKLLQHFPKTGLTQISLRLGRAAARISEGLTHRRRHFGLLALVSTFGSISCMCFPNECYLQRQFSGSKSISSLPPLFRGSSNFRSLKTRWQLQWDLDSLSLPHKIAGSTSPKRQITSQ